MSIKLFLTDLDGTLLPKGQKVSPKNIKAVQDLVKAGIIFTIATGRMYGASVEIAKSLDVDVPIITYNGALIKSVGGEIFYTNYLEPEIILEVTNFCEKNNWHLQNYSNDDLFYPEYNESAKFYEGAIGVKGKAIGWENMKKEIENVPKLLIITPNVEETERRIKILKEKFGDKINAMKSIPTFVEIIRPNVSKAAAAKILAEKFKIKNSEVMVIGDSHNDLPMLKAFEHSVAMGNAADEIKSVCEFVTDTCENDGFAQAIYNYVLNEEKNFYGK